RQASHQGACTTLLTRALSSGPRGRRSTSSGSSRGRGFSVTKQRIRLRGMSPELAEQSWESDRLLRVGRTGHVEITLEDTSISRRHAELALNEIGWVLRDMGSTNGTYLNGTRVGRADRQVHAPA